MRGVVCPDDPPDPRKLTLPCPQLPATLCRTVICPLPSPSQRWAISPQRCTSGQPSLQQVIRPYAYGPCCADSDQHQLYRQHCGPSQAGLLGLGWISSCSVAWRKNLACHHSLLRRTSCPIACFIPALGMLPSREIITTTPEWLHLSAPRCSQGRLNVILRPVKCVCMPLL